MTLILHNLPLFLMGLRATLTIAVVTLIASTLLGILLGTAASLPSRVLRWAVAGYVEIFRDIPLIVNVFAIFFGAPYVGVPLDPVPSVMLGLSLWGGANAAEIVRSGIAAVPRGQTEAARALGLRTWTIYLLVIWPQAVRAVLPAFTGLLALLIQSSSLGALVGVMDLLKAGGLVIEHSTVMLGQNPSFIIYGFVLLVYFAICRLVISLSRLLERRLSGRRTVMALAGAPQI